MSSTPLIPGIARWLPTALLVLVLPALASSGDACPETDAEALSWLDRMTRSLHEVSYHGVVTMQRGDDMQVMQVSHSVAGGASTERLTQLTGQGAQVERINHPLECIHPGHKLLQLGAELREGHCGIARFYRFSVGDGERVAGRRSVRLQIAPRDMYRYGYVMELDQETGLLLKIATLGRGNQTLEKFQFADLSYREQQPAGTEVNVIHHAQHPHLSAPAGPGLTAGQWAISWVPNGFTPTDTPPANGGRRTYTDGLAVFSVFLEELGQELRPGEGVMRSGGTTSYTRGMNLSGQPVLVTVIGEVPVNTARMVADSVAWAR